MLFLIFGISILTVTLLLFFLMSRKGTTGNTSKAKSRGCLPGLFSNNSPPCCEKPEAKTVIPSYENQKPPEKLTSYFFQRGRSNLDGNKFTPILINSKKQETVKTEKSAALKTETANNYLGKKQNIPSFFDKGKELKGNEQKPNEMGKQQNIQPLIDKNQELKEKEQTLSIIENVTKSFIECLNECNGHDKPSVLLDNAKNKLNSQIIIASLIIGNIKKDINRSRILRENYEQFLKKEFEKFNIFRYNKIKPCCMRFLAPQIQDYSDILNGKYGEIRFRFEGSKDHRAIKMTDSEINEEINGVINNATRYLHQSAVNRKNSEIHNQQENLNNKNRNFNQSNLPKPTTQIKNSFLKKNTTKT